MKNQIVVWVLAALTAVAVFIVFGAGTATAFTGGATGYSGNPATNGGGTCTSCHFGGVAPTVVLSGPATVNVGETNTYTLTISGGQEAFGGFDVSATDGALAAGAGSKLDGAEIIHDGAKAAAVDGTVSWSFDWTAPAAPGTATVYGAGNSTDGAGSGGDADATDSLAITVQGPNVAPVAVDDAYTTDQDTALTEALPGVLGNDTDSDPLTAVLDVDAANGTLALAADGSFTYTPDAAYTGSDTFTYHANDGTDDSNVATVTITVQVPTTNTAPVAVNDAYTTDGVVAATAGQGEADWNTYCAGCHTPGSKNGRSAMQITSANMTQGLSAARVEGVASYIGGGSGSQAGLVVPAAGVLSNDTDADGDTLSAVVDAGVSNGTLALSADGSFSYTPNEGYAGSDSFTYHANDGVDDSNSATVSITVTEPPEDYSPGGIQEAYGGPFGVGASGPDLGVFGYPGASVAGAASSGASGGTGVVGGTGGGLATTGSESGLPAFAGLGLLCVGGVALVASRRREI